MKKRNLEILLKVISTILWVITIILLLIALKVINLPGLNPSLSPGTGNESVIDSQKWTIFGVFLAISLISNIVIRVMHKKNETELKEKQTNKRTRMKLTKDKIQKI